MARFYADIQGNRGKATRMGTPKSGIGGHIRGWDVGARVQCYVGSKGHDVIDVYATGGSKNTTNPRLIARFEPRTGWVLFPWTE